MKTQRKKVKWILLFTIVVLFSGTAAYANGYPVMYDGHYLTFTAAKPQLINGRVMVPCEEFLRELGADVTYDSEKGQIRAEKDGVQIVLQDGQTALTIQSGKTAESVTMEAAPFINQDNGQLYASAKIAAEAFGYHVGWDDFNKTVVVIDWDGLLKQVQQEFSIVNMNTGASVDPEKTIRANVNGDITLTAGKEMLSELGMSPGERLQILMNVRYEMLQRANLADLRVNYQIDFSDLQKRLAKEDLTEEELSEIKDILDIFSDIDLHLKMDSDHNKLYVKSAMLAALESSIDGDTWYAMDLQQALSSGMGMNMLTAQILTTSQFSLDKMLNYYELTDNYDVYTYQEIRSLLDFAKNLIGDHAFQKSTVNGLDVYTVTIDKASIAQAVMKTPEFARQIGDISSFPNHSAVDFSVTLTIEAKDDVLSGYDMKYHVNLKEEGLTIKGRYQEQMQSSYASSGTLTMDLISEDVGSMRISLDLENTTNGNQRISGKPDVSQDKIVDITNELI